METWNEQEKQFGKIFQTKKYHLFKFHPLNRPINQKHVVELINSIDLIDLTMCRPVIINEKDEIIDGQHSFIACKTDGIDVSAIRVNLNGQSKMAMRKLNESNKKWGLRDYVTFYVNDGNKEYLQILNCERDYPGITISNASSIVSNTSSGHCGVTTGTFKVGKVPYKKICDILMDFKGLLYKSWNHVFFVRSIIFIVMSGKYDHSKEFNRFIKNRYALLGCADVQQYLLMFEEILNRGRRGDKIRFFFNKEDEMKNVKKEKKKKE